MLIIIYIYIFTVYIYILFLKFQTKVIILFFANQVFQDLSFDNNILRDKKIKGKI